ncbi:MAG: hypothetical protein JKY88_08025 [Pseudomonadales bacterium]|nr:hypothetical protein [Pseudomonadales bacterium]
MINKILTLCLFASMLFSCAGVEQAPKLEVDFPVVNFSGHWEIDHELTESPRDKIRWLYEVAKSQIEQQQRRQHQGGSIGPNLQNLSAINDLRAVVGLGTLAESISRANVLVIEQSDDAIVVKREGDYALSCDFTESEVRLHNLGNEYCHFGRNGQVVFLVALPEGLTVVNRMVLSADGRRLNVATTLISSDLDQQFTLNRVYMRFEAGRDMYDCKFTLKDKKTCWLGQ